MHSKKTPQKASISSEPHSGGPLCREYIHKSTSEHHVKKDSSRTSDKTEICHFVHSHVTIILWSVLMPSN